jgi:hypothetical protein
MSLAEGYFRKHKSIVQPIEEPPSGLLYFVVVIPAYLEENIYDTLHSLNKTKKSRGSVEIIIVVNFSEKDSKENKTKNLEIYQGLTNWCGKNSAEDRKYFTILADNLPRKHAGVGLARKIGMDEALRRFDMNKNLDGLILSLDADALVDENYFVAIENKMFKRSDFGGCIIQYAHPLSGNDYSPDVYNAVVQYELHLRYYKHILHYTGFPFAKYTIGTCFGVHAGFYAEQGGMNCKQAGEDFYFLNKLFPHKTFTDITETCVYPSPRPSLRVPFGTGATINRIIGEKGKELLTYTPHAFYDLKKFLSEIDNMFFYNSDKLKSMIEAWPIPVKDFLESNHFLAKYNEIMSNTTSVESFVKRFFMWFDGFMVVKFLNFSHKKYYKKVSIKEAVALFFMTVGYKSGNSSLPELLECFREKDRMGQCFY